MKYLFSVITKFFQYDHKEIVKKFASSELNEINYEIRQLENKRNRLEVMLFGN